MVSKKELLNYMIERYPNMSYDEKDDTVRYSGVRINFDDMYDKYIKSNGMSFRCICDVHWEDMSLIECTECGTVVKCYYDEFYEQNFRCPVCTDYKTGYEYYTKEQIESSEEIQAIINMYKELNKDIMKREARVKSRNGLEDYQLLKPRKIKVGSYVYEFCLLIDSITNKNKLQGLRLEIKKWEINDCTLVWKESKVIPLSRKSYIFYKKILPELQKNPEFDYLEILKGKSLTQTMEESAVKKLKNK